MKSKPLKKEILQLVQDQEQYQLYMRSKGRKSKKKRKQDTQSTKWDIVLLVFVVIIVYFILYKVIMIVIQIKIVNQNADHSSQLAIEKPYPLKSNQLTKAINKNTNQNKVTQNIVKKVVEQSTQIVSPPQASKVQSALLSPEQIQKLMTQQNLKTQQQQLLAKLRQNMLEQSKLQQKTQGKQTNTNLPQVQGTDNLSKQAQQNPATTTSPPAQPPKQIQATPPVNRAGITSEAIAMGVKLVNLKNLPKNDPLADKQREYYEQKYHLSKYQQKLSFCVIVPSYNNIANNRYLNNINSILQQEYSNYHIVFIDDASTDQTFSKLDEYLKTKELPDGKIKMIKNQKQMFAMHNLRKSAMEYCQPEQIFMIVDGDDQLLGRQVFRFFNAMFQQKKAYFIFTNFITVRGSMGYSRQFPQRTKKDNTYRSYPFVTSHLRAFYTKLFQLIDDKDLRDEKGEYYRAANDVAICIPILEMSHTRVEYIPQLNYVYNSATGLNNHKLRLSEQKSNDRKIRAKKKYTQVLDLFQVDKTKQNVQKKVQKQQKQSQFINRNLEQYQIL